MDENQARALEDFIETPAFITVFSFILWLLQYSVFHSELYPYSACKLYLRIIIILEH